ncbi:Cyclopentanol dehydrogenase [Mesorhizobium metallidurans STM 2683]|uniref:Cyclopentanol dehydrogenase n=1 Tax=Mesorhizobium metallidurans STM 2683 TaxID=1297569 RepID=M5EWI2_9HYPH|nr:SDR family oxidoreductase [Mesorhizobium metallidurans]CCV04041.1 Cyclopentanol dehydrogenase [Mesorhizobium metallidurans STM 2683]
MGRLQDKVAIVTGGARGIGGATVRRFVEEGAKVAIIDVLEDDGEALAKELCDGGAEAIFLKVDITKEQEVQAAVDKVVKKWGRLDILVNNAAITGVNKFAHEVTVEEWDKVFDVNVKGTFLCTKYAVRPMMEQKSGAIVNFSSIYGLIGNDDIPPYHATKGATLMMSKTDAICYAPYGIRVNAVHPGSTMTEIFMKCADTYPRGKQAYLDMMKEKHPLRLGEPVDVANCVLFLASEEARFVTGASLVVDGGYTTQ